ncbi:transporter substrate-binding domain-containing protein [Lacimicrobium sp. SS2-24]|uniref:substrate-binding periplasmic protein n=1 Tax=Lacimicrobium sp. SS2-24 TaxID=2005569 RepID=UPI000B4B5F2E|nr:transporter substrate-binding domain-containing protein [Lacimicrobium sp. SS2-24]
MIYRVALLFTSLMLFSVIGSANTDQGSSDMQKPLPPLTLLTENFAPFNYVEQEQVKGFTVDVVEQILAATGSAQSRADMQVLPWASAYQQGLLRPDTMLFTLIHTEHRDPLFRWIGPLVPTRVVVIAKRNMEFSAESVEDLSGLVIGTVGQDVGEQLLIESGFSVRNIVSEDSPKTIVEMLKRNHLNAIAYDDISAFWYLDHIGEDLNKYEIIYTLQESHQYIGLSRATPKWVEDRLQDALNQLKYSEKYRQLISQYPVIEHALYPNN